MNMIETLLERNNALANARSRMQERFWEYKGAYCPVSVAWDEHNMPTMQQNGLIEYN